MPLLIFLLYTTLNSTNQSADRWMSYKVSSNANPHTSNKIIKVKICIVKAKKYISKDSGCKGFWNIFPVNNP